MPPSKMKSTIEGSLHAARFLAVVDSETGLCRLLDPLELLSERDKDSGVALKAHDSALKGKAVYVKYLGAPFCQQF